MSSLQLLPANTVRLIGSGQVITSVVSVVKELIENSLDAGANSVEIKLENYGFDKIEIRDNGCGIKPSDAPYMAQRHFTSKIREQRDLEFVESYGFRGEALASLCAVADVSITTRTDEDEVSTVYELNHQGKILGTKPSHLGQGTTIAALHLFKNLPVRKQYYNTAKKKKEEMKRVEDLIISYGVICPDVRISFRHNKDVIWQKNVVPDHRNVLLQCFGMNVMNNLEHLVQTETETQVQVEAYLPKKYADAQHVTRATNDRCFVYVNKRPVQLKYLEKIIKQSYIHASVCDTNRYPIIFLSIKVPPNHVDVNIDPNKTKVMLHEKEKILLFLEDILKNVYSTDPDSLQKQNTLQEKNKTDLNQANNEQDQKINACVALTDETNDLNQGNSEIEMLNSTPSCTLTIESGNGKVCEGESSLFIGEFGDEINSIDKNYNNDKCNGQYTHSSSTFLDNGVSDSLHENQTTCNEPQNATTDRELLSQNTNFDLLDNDLNNFLQSQMPSTCSSKNKTDNPVLDSEQNREDASNEHTCKDRTVNICESAGESSNNVSLISPADDVHIQNGDVEGSTHTRGIAAAGQDNDVPVETGGNESVSCLASDLDVSNMIIPPPSKIYITNTLHCDRINTDTESSLFLSSNGMEDNLKETGTCLAQGGQNVSNTGASSCGDRSWSMGHGLVEKGKLVQPVMLLPPSSKSSSIKKHQQSLSLSKLGGGGTGPSPARKKLQGKQDDQPTIFDLINNQPIKRNVTNHLGTASKRQKIDEDEHRSTQKCARFSMKTLKMSILKHIQNIDSRIPSWQSFSLIGLIKSHGVWLCSHGNSISLLNPHRAQEIVLYKNLLSTYKITAGKKDVPIVVTKSMIGSSILWNTLLSLDSSIHPPDPYIFLSDERLTSNGFRIRHIDAETNGTVEIYALADFIPFYGVNDLTEILQHVADDQNCSLEQCRPLKIKNYLKGEAMRMSRQSTNIVTQDDADELVSNLDLDKKLTHDLLCLHGKKVLTDVFNMDFNKDEIEATE